MSEKVHLYTGKAIKISYAVKRCIHAAECSHGLPPVFNPAAKPWINPDGADADAVAEVILRCPTGALHFERLDGGQAESPAARNSVTIAADGPLYLRGQVEVVAANQQVLLADTRVALCRCGASKNKPFCDGSHEAIHFQNDGTVSATSAESTEATVQPGKLRVVCSANGPFLLQGPVAIFDAFGEPAGKGDGAALCRCGGSNKKPFCDGSHKRVGFISD